VIADLGDQIDQLNKAKAKVEQQKNSLLLEKNEMLAAVEDMTIEKVSLSINILKQGAF